MVYKHVIIGGTFDHFHVGHEAMLQKAFDVAEKVSIGITTSQMYQGKALAHHIEPFETREQFLKTFLEKKGWLSRAVLIPISSKYGSTLTDPTIEAIVVSPETEEIARQITKERVAKGLSDLEIVTVPFVLSDEGKIVSSERIRRGEIARDGTSYSTFLHKNPNLHLPASLREELQKPIGKVVTNALEVKQFLSSSSLLISVGDIVTTSLMQDGIIPHISIIDFRTRRHALDKSLIEKFFSHVQVTLHNPPGTINDDFAQLFLGILHNKPTNEVIRIEGEEDLLTMPAILLSPLGTYIIYGQFEVGMVVVEVTEEIKDMIKRFIIQFT